jgi:hypothetical protein
MFGHSEIVAFLLHRFHADKPAPLLRLLELHIRKSPEPIGIAAHP